MLIRDREQGVVVEDKEEYVEALLETLVERVTVVVENRKEKDKQRLYEALSDAHELYNVLVTQCLQATTELATKARYEKAHRVAKERAETLGGYFNGNKEG